MLQSSHIHPTAIFEIPERVVPWPVMFYLQHTGTATACRSEEKLGNIIKKRLGRRDQQHTVDALEGLHDNGEHKKGWHAQALLLAAVNSKLEEGNVRSATRILCSREFPVKASNDTFAAMQERNPADSWSANLAHLPDTASTI